MPIDAARVKTIFLAAVEKSAVERVAFLDQACPDVELRRRVEALLRAHDEPGDVDTSGPGEKAGAWVGPYRLLEKIGEGGMAVVWMAEQEVPVKRRVALKLIRPGMDSAQVIARFEAERQALALMDHPNIARVLDAGTTESGRPFFVMELVKGVPITTYCDEQRLPPRERLELFVPVCEAVQHAHQKGIIHRDLKPSNVLVALYDGRAVPKVIDFGVAKATGQKLTERTLFTGFGAVVGTPEYMSPEQAQLNNLDVDTRSDVYALGVLLYELLTGSTPLSRKRLKDGALLEVLRLIREEEPQRPSVRLSSSAGLPSVAACRGTEPARLTRLLKRELDWVVMRALEKDRARRYATANALARDLQRYLADEPVEACPPTARYRLRKFARKNRRLLALATVLVGLLLLVVVVLGLGLLAVQRERMHAAMALEEARANMERALAAEAEARANQARAEANFRLARQAVDEYLGVAKEHPLMQGPNTDKLRKLLLEKALPFYRQFRSQRPDDPALNREDAEQWRRVAAITGELGRKGEAAGAYEQARQRYQALVQAHPDDPTYRHDLANTLTDLAQLLAEQGKHVEALPLFERALVLRRGLAKGAGASPAYREALARTLLGRAGALRDAGKGKEAVQACEEARAIREKLAADYPNVAGYRAGLGDCLTRLGALLGAEGRLREAEPILVKARELSRELVRAHPNVPEHQRRLAGAANGLGVVLARQGKGAEAMQLFQQARALLRALAQAHADVTRYRHDLGGVLQNMGDLLEKQGRRAEARKAYEEAKALRKDAEVR
jgi:serine/threonine protein kinase